MNYIITIYFDPEGKINTFGSYFIYYYIIGKKRDDPLVENPKIFRNFFLFWGGRKKDPPPLGNFRIP